MHIVIVTGMSGAGKSSALNIFEDMGYYCMDNLPPQLMTNFIELARDARHEIEHAAIGMDIRGGHFFEALNSSMENLKASGTIVSVLFVEADDEVLIRRYKEGRRPHPLDKAGNIYDGIQRERAMLRNIRNMADAIIDTSRFNLGELKQEIESIYREQDGEQKLLISISSFGFKYGLPLDADLVFDARFVPNPYYVPELRPKTGIDTEVSDYVLSYPEAQEFIRRLQEMLVFLFPLYLREGKRSLVVAVGCTGGRHRSVAIAQELADRLKGEGRLVSVTHRDQLYWQR